MSTGRVLLSWGVPERRMLLARWVLPARGTPVRGLWTEQRILSGRKSTVSRVLCKTLHVYDGFSTGTRGHTRYRGSRYLLRTLSLVFTNKSIAAPLNSEQELLHASEDGLGGGLSAQCTCIIVRCPVSTLRNYWNKLLHFADCADELPNFVNSWVAMPPSVFEPIKL